MKNFIFFFLIASSLTAFAGDKGNGEHPISKVDDEFISQKDILCPKVMNSTIYPETITFNIDGVDRTYDFQVVREYCEEHQFEG